MIYFGIPLRSKYSSNNWEKVCLLFNRTLWSLYNQSDPDFRIIIACHEIPKLDLTYDSRVEFIQVDTPCPNNFTEQMIDKSYKIHSVAVRIRQYGGGFALIADADDLYSKRIAGFVKKHSNKNGWVISLGFDYIFGSRFLNLSLKHPPQPIVNYTIEDLPESMDDATIDSQKNINLSENLKCKYLIKKGHGNIPNVCKSIGRPLSVYPYPAHIYVKYTGDNHSILSSGGESNLRIYSRYFMPKINIIKNDFIRNEFSINWI